MRRCNFFLLFFAGPREIGGSHDILRYILYLILCTPYQDTALHRPRYLAAAPDALLIACRAQTTWQDYYRPALFCLQVRWVILRLWDIDILPCLVCATAPHHRIGGGPCCCIPSSSRCGDVIGHEARHDAKYSTEGQPVSAWQPPRKPCV